MAVVAGGVHSGAVGEDGTLFMWGVHVGAVPRGAGVGEFRLIPTIIAVLPAPVRQVDAGVFHTGIVTDAGDLLMCGEGGYGKLGLGGSGEDNRPTPTLVARALFDGAEVLMVSCGVFHTAVVTEGGCVYTFGRGEEGQLGHGDAENQLEPRRVPAAGFNNERVMMVAARGLHTVALSEEGHAYTWGWGEDGQLGHNDAENQHAPRQVEPGRFGGDKVLFVATGGRHTVAVKSGGHLYTWGAGGYGKLGLGDTGNRLVPTLVVAGEFRGAAAVMAACGSEHTLVVTHDGALWACGRGDKGQLGLDNSDERHVFERVGAGEFGGASVVAAAGGAFHSVAVTEDGALWTWGDGHYGQLGHGDEANRPVPTVVAEAGLGGGRIGRCRGLPAEHALAFAMGTHVRLGAASPARCLAGEEGLLRIIVRWCRRWRWVGGAAGREEGMVRLLGGGLLLESVRGLVD